MRWGTLERVPQTPQNFSKTGLRLPGIGTFRAFLCLFLRGEAVVGGGVPVTEEERKKIGTAHRFRSRATIKKSRKVLGGSGDSFKSPPAHPCPLRALAPQAPPMPLPAQPRGCKGRSPLHKKTKNPPFPGGEGGRGDGGRKASQKQGWQATRKARPPPGNGKARSASKAENSFKSPPAHPRPKNAAGARQATGGRRRRTDPPNAEGKAGGREPRCTGHPEAQPRRDPPESG